MMKKFNSSSSFQTIIIEFVSIVVGVLLALGLNQWRENANNDERAQAALVNMKTELESNLNTLDYIYKNNKAALEFLEHDKSLNPDTAQPFIPGIQLQEVAWNAINRSGISTYLDYEIIIQLSSTYTMQRVYKQTAHSFIEANLNLSAYSIALGNQVKEKDLTQGFKDTFIMLNTIEAQLIESYKETLTLLKDEEK